MGINIWKTHYDFLYGHLDENKYDFVNQFFPVSDDGTYYVNNNKIDRAIREAQKQGMGTPEGYWSKKEARGY